MNIEISDTQLQSWKDTYAKLGIVYDNDDDCSQAIYNLVGFFDVLIQMDQQQKSKPAD